ncbi:MAG: hypothetical protein HPY74_08180 [Firmicutes bacterium]|nr:hypothetical protein [Bacillota bacterium]
MYRDKKRCEYCGEEIYASVRRCPFCGSLLQIEKCWDVQEISRESFKIYPEVNVPDTGTDSINTGDTNSEKINNQETGFILVGEPYKKEESVAIGTNPLSNGLKVFLTIISTIIPGFGQLLGIITAIFFMNSEEDPDRRSFGLALLIASLLMFTFTCLFCFIVILIASKIS